MRKKTCKGVGQAFAYLIGAFQSVGTFLGLAVIGSRFMRILVADPTTLLVELELDEGEGEGSELASLSARRMKAADLLSREDLFDLVPNSLLGPYDIETYGPSLPMDKVERLWDFQGLGWKVLAGMVVAEDGRMRRLPPAPQRFRDVLEALSVRVDVGGDEEGNVVWAARHGHLGDDEDEDKGGVDGGGGDEEGDGEEHGDPTYDPDENLEDSSGSEGRRVGVRGERRTGCHTVGRSALKTRSVGKLLAPRSGHWTSAEYGLTQQDRPSISPLASFQFQLGILRSISNSIEQRSSLVMLVSMGTAPGPATVLLFRFETQADNASFSGEQFDERYLSSC